MSETTVKQQLLMIHGEHKGFTGKKGEKQGMRRSGRETEFWWQGDGRHKRFRRQLGSNLSSASCFLTADGGIASWWHNCTALATREISGEKTEVICVCGDGVFNVKISDDMRILIKDFTIRRRHMKLASFLTLLVYYGSSNTLRHIHTKPGQMMSSWWNTSSADRLSKPVREGQRQF